MVASQFKDRSDGTEKQYAAANLVLQLEPRAQGRTLGGGEGDEKQTLTELGVAPEAAVYFFSRAVPHRLQLNVMGRRVAVTLDESSTIADLKRAALASFASATAGDKAKAESDKPAESAGTAAAVESKAADISNVAIYTLPEAANANVKADRGTRGGADEKKAAGGVDANSSAGPDAGMLVTLFGDQRVERRLEPYRDGSRICYEFPPDALVFAVRSLFLLRLQP